jgi:putative SOS response-associated peptidase YedK
VCTLYSLRVGQDTLRRYFKITRDETGNQPSMLGIAPGMMAPVVRQDEDVRVMEPMRWGFPPPLNYSRPATPVTNVRYLRSSYWRSWLKREHRCLVPATSFCEWTDSRPKVTYWFALDDSRPLFAFAGIWRLWVGEHRVYALLTTEANEIVRPIHSKAMPVMLTGEACDAWLTASIEDAIKLQRPLPNEALRIVATRARTDG